ncbi:MAG: response regulator [Syntrophomonas sp.]|nr:response regulator [Syntrophomonas sp.]
MDTNNGKIGVIIIEDDLPVRQLIHSYLTEFSKITVLGEVSTGEEVLEMLDSLQPKVVFLDIELPNISGLSTATLLKQKNPHINYRVVLSAKAAFFMP